MVILSEIRGTQVRGYNGEVIYERPDTPTRTGAERTSGRTIPNTSNRETSNKNKVFRASHE